MEIEKGYESDFESGEENDEDHLESATNYRQLILLNMLSCVNAEEYLPILEHYNITHESIRLLKDDDLVVMGILDNDHRKDLLNYISSLPPLQRKSNYIPLDEPLLNYDVILNLSKHVDLLTLSLREGLNKSCCINDITCRKPNYKQINDPIVYPEGVNSSKIAIDTINYVEKKLNDLNTELNNSVEMLGIPSKEYVPKKIQGPILPCLGIVLISVLSFVLVKNMKTY